MNVGFVVFPQFLLLDLAGPMAAFEVAQLLYGGNDYHIRVVSCTGGTVLSSSGMPVETHPIRDVDYDTLIITGGQHMQSACDDRELVECISLAARTPRRVASICTGAFLLAEAGLLDGRRATTHWRFAPELQARHPQVQLDADRIYIRDGRFWSSAGITAGIDLALALIGDDLGEAVAKKIAQDLVVYHRRPGGQSQYSALLSMDSRSERIALALDYARENLTAPLSVEDLAAQANLSPRQFARVFRDETGHTPAKAIERLRCEAAVVRIEGNPSESLEEIAHATGFHDLERMRRACIRLFGRPPQSIRRAAKLQT